MSKKIATVLLVIIAVGLIIPQPFENPVARADKKSYNQSSFWYYPWGQSVTHKGVDIFAKTGTPVHAATPGLVVYTGKLGAGGQVVLMIGPKWRLHYYAHLNTIDTEIFSWNGRGETIGTVGTTGNAQGRPPHLHYTIATIVPYPWRIDSSRQGWKKMFFLDPIPYLNSARPAR